MAASNIGSEVRRLVAQRADHLCEYCLLHEDDSFFGCEIDHIISRKHGGGSEVENLAYACLTCNRNKGSDIASLAADSSTLVRLFNPRRDRWREHFWFAEDAELTIEPLTPIGEATARLLGFNTLERRLERIALHQAKRYPTPEAWERIRW